MSKGKIIVSVTNDLVTDQRVDKICKTLTKIGFEVQLVGRVLKGSLHLNREYATKRFHLLFNKGPLFYANYNIRLFFFLLFKRFDVLWSNDLDTLLANYVVSQMRNKRLIFDSHEYFTEVPELIDRPGVKAFWKYIEKKILPKLKVVTTVSDSIAKLYRDEYNIDVKLLRNVPPLKRKAYSVPNIALKDKKIILYQGSININRGIENMVMTMHHIDNAIFYLIGKGDITQKIEQLIKKEGLTNKVKMMGEIPQEKLHEYTHQADLGISLEEDKGLNYRLTLPNKLFNYIHAGLPVLVSPLPEMKNLVTKYKIGTFIEKREPSHIAECINNMLSDNKKLETWKLNSKKAMHELNWEKEETVIKELF